MDGPAPPEVFALALAAADAAARADGCGPWAAAARVIGEDLDAPTTRRVAVMCAALAGVLAGPPVARLPAVRGPTIDSPP